MDERLTTLEEQVAYLTRTVEDLSDVIARQDRELERLRRQTQMLLEREASREAELGGSVSLADERPPHW